MEHILYIKTLPHLYKSFTSIKDSVVYSDLLAPGVIGFIENLVLLEKSKITYKNLVTLINDARSFENHQITFNRVKEVTSILEFSIAGDTIVIWPIGYEFPLRFEFFGQELERIILYDNVLSKKISEIDFFVFSKSLPADFTEIQSIHFEYRSEKISKFIFTHSLNIPENSKVQITDFTYPNLFYSRFDLLEQEINRLKANKYKIHISTENIDSIPDALLEYTKKIELDLNLDYKLIAGFISEKLKIAYFTDRELFGNIYLSRPERLKNSSNIKKLLSQFEGNIEIGDYVVHEDYGVAMYDGLKQEIIDEIAQEYLLLKYAESDELYVPINQIYKITKYIGSEGMGPKLTRLGKTSWEHLKTKIKAAAQNIAKELIEHYAKREIAVAKSISKGDSQAYDKFVDKFPYKETDDQIRAINEILSDLEKTNPMSRLLVGDVGFGKTEVFLRAAFKIIENGGQVAILSPTTVLAAQHAKVATERFSNTSARIATAFRFNSKIKNKTTLEKLEKGEVDLIIGTQRLLSDDVHFKNLQLIIIDEEQRFGVKQKEKIKKLNYGVHVLSVSATPIPRTLSLALSSIQELSVITQPPSNRKPIHTEILKDLPEGKTGWNKVVDGIEKEINRGGQVFFLHNEVQSIQSIKTKLQNLMPGVRFAIGHGQMKPEDLDTIMTEFFEKKFDVLICTTIIENGLDMPNVNTIIVNNADRFGLSQLYQLRGRVGRSETQAYCYLLTSQNTKTTGESDLIQEQRKRNEHRKYLMRLQTLVENQELGSGFRVSSRDLEIRGAGNILGEEQSGNINTIGYALYIEILAQEVQKLQNTESTKFEVRSTK